VRHRNRESFALGAHLISVPDFVYPYAHGGEQSAPLRTAPATVGSGLGAGVVGVGVGLRDGAVAVAIGLGAAVLAGVGFGGAVLAVGVGDAAVVAALGVPMTPVAADGLDGLSAWLIAATTPRHAKKKTATITITTRPGSQVGAPRSHLNRAIDRNV